MRLNPCARAAGISADTLRHYLREGLVEAAGRANNGYRTFDDRTVARVRFIRSAVGLGFTLAAVAELLRMSAHGNLPCPRARQLLGVRIAQQRRAPGRDDRPLPAHARRPARMAGHARRGARWVPGLRPDRRCCDPGAGPPRQTSCGKTPMTPFGSTPFDLPTELAR